MMRCQPTVAGFGALLAVLLFATASFAYTPEVPSRVFLNGKPTPVYFNDGDSFKVLAGELEGTRGRLAGFNTLESYGAVHRWGGWHEKEMYSLAKMATMNARRGVWHCESELKRDTYGRILWFCLDLAVDQVRRGLAHGMTISEEPGHPDVMAAQADAIKHRRGIWAHGVPEYVLTSLHSVDEGGGKDGKTYNRMVSSRDGHSASMRHTESYDLCQWVCSSERDVPEAKVQAAVKALRARPEIAAFVSQYDARLEQIARDWGTLGWFVGIDDEEHAKAFTTALEALDGSGAFGNRPPSEGSCVLYVPFKKRFGKAQATCLK